MAEYGRSSIAARVAQQASQNQNRIISGGEAPDMSKAPTTGGGFAGGIGRSILGRLGLGGGGGKTRQARAAIGEGGDYEMEERNFTVVDKETGEEFDMSKAASGANDDQDNLIYQHANHNMFSNSELHQAGQVAILDNTGQAVNMVTRDIDIQMEDGSTKTVTVTSYSDANSFISDPEKAKSLVLRQVRKNLTEIYGNDTNTIEHYVDAFNTALDGKQTDTRLQKALNAIRIRGLDQDSFNELMLNKPRALYEAQLAKAKKGNTPQEIHTKVYEDDTGGVTYAAIANSEYSVEGSKKNFNFSTRYSDHKSTEKVSASISEKAKESMENNNLTYTGTGVAKFDGLRFTAQTQKEGAFGTIEAGTGQGTYGTLMKSAVADNLIKSHTPTDTSVVGWDKSADYNNKINYLVENKIIANPDKMKFENREEEMEFKAAAVAYYDNQVMPQLQAMYKKGVEASGGEGRYVQKMTAMYNADRALAKELYIAKSKLRSINDVSLGNSGVGGSILNDRLNNLNKNDSFMGGATSYKGEFGIEYGDFDFNTIVGEVNNLDKYGDKAAYIKNLADNNIITSEAAEVLNDLARFQDVNGKSYQDKINAIESRLSIGDGVAQIEKVNKEIKTNGSTFVPVSLENRHLISNIEYNKDSGVFETGGSPLAFGGYGIEESVKAQGKIATNRANFTVKLNSNYRNLTEQDGLTLSKEQYFSILRKKFANDYTKDNNFGLGEQEYKDMQTLFNDYSDEELVSYSVNIDKATR